MKGKVRKIKCRRIMAFAIAFFMLLAVTPIGSIQVHAAESEYRQFFTLLGSANPATIDGLVEVSGPDADGYRTFKLLKDITADSDDTAYVSIKDGSSGSPRKIILDLNGYTINRNLTSESGAGTSGCAFFMSDYIDLIIDDSTATGTPGEGDYVAGKITGGAYSGIYSPRSTSILTLRNGIITGNCNTNSGGGISCDYGSLIIEGGEICDNVSTNNTYGGGGVYATAPFKMTGGAIYGNKVTTSGGRGGGIFIFGTNAYSITGGKIFDNECSCTSYGTAGAGLFVNNSREGSEIGGSVQIYDNKNTTKPDLPSNFYAYQYPENIKIVPFAEEGRMGYSCGPTYGSVIQIAKEITLADLSHITSEYAASDNIYFAYCGGEDIHINLAGKNIANMKDHNTHTAGTLWASYHNHSYSYAKSGDFITAYCFYAGCPDGSSSQNKITLELSAESRDYSATKTYAGAKIIDADGTEIKSDNVNKWTSAGFPVPSIKIYKANSEGATSGGTEVSDLIGLELGNYYAYVKVGSASLSKAFKINTHTHNWVYTAGTGDDANKITATCTPEVGTCPDDKTATLTLTASGPNYSGIDNLEAFNTATGESIEESNVEIYKVNAANTTIGGNKVTETPTEDGYYYAKLTVGEEAAVKAFTVGTPTPEPTPDIPTPTPDPVPTPAPAPEPVFVPEMKTENIAGATFNTWEEITVNTPKLTVEDLHKVNDSNDDLLHVNIVGKEDKTVPVAVVQAVAKSSIDGLHVFIGESDAITFLSDKDYSNYTGISFKHEDVVTDNSRIIDFTSKGNINATVLFHTLIAPNVRAKVYKVVDGKEVEIATLSSNEDGGFCFEITELAKYIIRY